MTQQSRSGGSPAERAEALLTRCRGRFLKALREAAEEVIHHPDWLDALTRAAGECFDELASARPGQVFDDSRSLTASRMNLVQDNETDYSIGLINLDQRLHDYCGRDLAALHMRMRMQLMGTPMVLQDESPLGTESVCRALRGLKEVERLSATEALRLAQQLEEPLRRHLSGFYRSFEHELANESLGSRVRGRPQHVDPEPEPEEANSADGRPGRAGLAIQPVDALRLSVLARHEDNPSQPPSNLDPGLASALIERIEAWLGERQQYGAGVPVALGASELGALLSPVKAAAVEVIETICNYALDAPRLPAAFRSLIARLRVPLLRLALRSETLLAPERHAALRLVDQIANLGRTLAPDCSPELPVCRGLLAIVNTLVHAPRISDKEFEAALGAVEELVTSRQRTALARAAAFKDEVERMERRDVALQHACRALYLVIGHAKPSPVRNFLENYWVHVIAKVAYRHGSDSVEWATRLHTANRLLASVDDSQGARSLKRRIADIPYLIEELKEGLAWVGLTESRIWDALAPCMALHANLIAGKPAPEFVPRRSSCRPTLGRRAEKNGLRVLKHKQYVPGELPLPPAWAALEVGDPVSVALPDDSVMRGFVALFAPQRQAILIADGDQNLQLSITARALSQQVELPESQLFRAASLVDEAASNRLLQPGPA